LASPLPPRGGGGSVTFGSSRCFSWSRVLKPFSPVVLELFLPLEPFPWGRVPLHPPGGREVGNLQRLPIRGGGGAGGEIGNLRRLPTRGREGRERASRFSVGGPRLSGEAGPFLVGSVSTTAPLGGREAIGNLRNMRAMRESTMSRMRGERRRVKNSAECARGGVLQSTYGIETAQLQQNSDVEAKQHPPCPGARSGHILRPFPFP
jgi:hypothetical protein